MTIGRALLLVYGVVVLAVTALLLLIGVRSVKRRSGDLGATSTSWRNETAYSKDGDRE
jgi:hypothetical protein